MELLIIAVLAGLTLLGWPAIQRQQAARVLALRYLRKQCQQENLQLLHMSQVVLELLVTLVNCGLELAQQNPLLIQAQILITINISF